jgi:hypothetical protein
VAKTCRCGFDLVQHDPAQAIVHAQAELTRGKRLLWLGLAGTAIVIALLIAFDAKLSWARWFFYRSAPGRLRVEPFKALLGVLPSLPLVALGRGAWLVAKAYPRLIAGKRMQQLPRARLV